MWYFKLVESNRVPDWLLRLVVRTTVGRSLRRRYQTDIESRHAQKRALIQKFRQSPIAIHTADVNLQHYEVPTRFFQLALGQRLKYSCCYWPQGTSTLDQSEEAMLALTCQRAQLEDGMTVLDLGCGWGSLTLWIAEHYPNCQILAVSNSETQIAHIGQQAHRRGYGRVEAQTADVTSFQPGRQFDRVISVEMFEHLKNYETIMGRIAAWLVPAGKLFVHIFSHREFAHEFDAGNPNSWMARTFFAGGTMPSDDLLLHFQRELALADHWRVSGTHYARTLRAWLDKVDAHKGEIIELFAQSYGQDQAVRHLANWRLFFLACEETWKLNRGREYIVSHYLFEKETNT